jgi:hypothetical protein
MTAQIRQARYEATAHSAWLWWRPRSTISRRYSSARLLVGNRSPGAHDLEFASWGDGKPVVLNPGRDVMVSDIAHAVQPVEDAVSEQFDEHGPVGCRQRRLVRAGEVERRLMQHRKKVDPGPG